MLAMPTIRMSDIVTGKASLIVFLAALAAPSSAMTQAEAPAADPSIVVTGQAPLSEDQALTVVRRVAQPVDGQLARFHERVCPAVIGFDTPYEAMVTDWIKATAEKVGAEIGGEGCAANLFVVIVDDGPGFVRELAERDDWAVAGMSPRELGELAGAEGAARSWSTTLLTNSMGTAAGMPSPTAGSGAVKVGFGGSSVSFGNVPVMRVYEASNANPSVQQTIHSAWVVLETEATLGKSLRQIADYAAMRGLAMVRPDMLDGSEDTILDLFEPGVHNSPPALTEFDLAYLTSLYRVPSLRWARSQVRYMADAIARDAEAEAP
jgi:hypothetical protein